MNTHQLSFMSLIIRFLFYTHSAEITRHNAEVSLYELARDFAPGLGTKVLRTQEGGQHGRSEPCLPYPVLRYYEAAGALTPFPVEACPTRPCCIHKNRSAKAESLERIVELTNLSAPIRTFIIVCLC